MGHTDTDSQADENPEIAGFPATDSDGNPRAGQITTRGRWAQVNARPTMFRSCSGSLGDLIHDIEGAGWARVQLVGPAPWHGLAGVRSWAAGELPEGWHADGAGHYFHGAQPVLRYRHEPSGERLEVSRAASWFGDGAYSPELAHEAWSELGRRIGDTFGGAVLMSTPATTGRDLILRSLGDHEYPVLPSELQQLIRSTSGQGRIELFRREPGARLTGLVEYDGRMMYAGCLAELPGGEVRHDHGGDFLGYTRARYRVDFTVPRSWCHVGLIGVTDEDGGWSWPNEPGDTGHAWVDGAELATALDYGWPVTIRERLYWPDRARPLDVWGNRMQRVLEAPSSPELAPLLRAGVRSIVLHGIGALHGRGYKVSRSSPDGADIPSSAGPVVLDRATGLYAWSEDRGQAWPSMAHPEWTAAIWGRARARLLSCPTGDRHHRAGMLHVNPRKLIACRTDAVYLTTDPEWSDDGRVGRLSRRLVAPCSAPWPSSQRELLTLRDSLRNSSTDTMEVPK
jgi:hypothetical protein